MAQRNWLKKLLLKSLVKLTTVMRPEDPRKNRLHYFERFLTELKGTTFYFFKYVTCHLAVLGVIVGELYYLHWLMKLSMKK